MPGTMTLFLDGKGTPQERLGFGMPIGGTEQTAKVPEVGGDCGMLPSEAGFMNSHRPA